MKWDQFGKEKWINSVNEVKNWYGDGLNNEGHYLLPTCLDHFKRNIF